MYSKSRIGFNSTLVTMLRLHCGICNTFSMLVAADKEEAITHAQCGNANCKSNREEER